MAGLRSIGAASSAGSFVSAGRRHHALDWVGMTTVLPTPSSGGPAVGDGMLLETADFLILETGDYLLLE